MNDYTSETAGMLVGFFLFGVPLVLFILAYGRALFYQKCQQPKWTAYVPFYSSYVFFTKICHVHPMLWGLQTLCIVIYWFFSSSNDPLPFLFLCMTQTLPFFNLSFYSHKSKIMLPILGGVFYWIVMAYYGFFNKFEYDPLVKLPTQKK